MSILIGIDLGTTNSVAAHLTDQGPKLIPNALGEVLTPSIVGIDPDGKLLVGRAAKELQVLHPNRCAALFKRHMGSDWKVTLNGRTYSPEELSSLVLRTIKEDAEAHFKEPVPRAVITVPAYFNDQQRKACAGQRAQPRQPGGVAIGDDERGRRAAWSVSSFEYILRGRGRKRKRCGCLRAIPATSGTLGDVQTGWRIMGNACALGKQRRSGR